ncbi:hypothetical protein TNCT_113671 [Trichonephila clavata]|uniref:Uncharacterized protein n=1 Tax=Trichonephila clavata TaxID=2740835 RepID=A0A8X6FIS7_TRICU|nr:hypothetical protein TNCT_113671 [Trichonephila clavata]
MVFSSDQPLDMDFQHVSLPTSGTSTREFPIDLEKSVSEFGSFPYCNTPGCPVHKTPTSSPLKSHSTNRKGE